MLSNKIEVRDGDGKVIDPATMRPTAHSTVLNGYVGLMIAAGDSYGRKVESDAARVTYTVAGMTDMKQGHARTVLADVAAAFRRAKQQAVGELGIADDRYSAALRNRLPPVDAVRVAIGAQLLDDERRRGLLVQKVAHDVAEISFEDVERIEAGAVLPLVLTGLTASQRAAWRAWLVPEQADALKRAREAAHYVDELVATLVRKIAADAPLNYADVAQIVGESVTDAMQVNYGKRFNEAPMHEVYKSVSATEPLVSGDKVTDGLNEEAVA